MKEQYSKYPDMPKILAALRKDPSLPISVLARQFNIPDSTIRGAWRWEKKRIEEEKRLQEALGGAHPCARNGHILPEIEAKPLNHIESAARASTEVGKRIIVIGDTQVKPNIDLSYLSFIGQYCADKLPDIIVCIGDFADMPSCSFHEQPGSAGYAAQNYKNDIVAVHRGMRLMMEPILKAMETGWKPRLVMTLGNHEDRIDRAIEATPKLDGTIGLPDLEYERWGWEVIPFLTPIEIEGVVFSHYFPTGQMGRPMCTAQAMINKLHMSAVAGHVQGRDIKFGKKANGKMITAIICGSTYEHDEDYLNAQTNNHWRGLYVLNDVRDGEFEENAVSMRYLRRKYGG